MDKKKDTADEQRKRFIETARELECDESPKAFEDTFSRIVPPKSGNNGNSEDEKA